MPVFHALRLVPLIPDRLPASESDPELSTRRGRRRDPKRERARVVVFGSRCSASMSEVCRSRS